MEPAKCKIIHILLTEYEHFTVDGLHWCDLSHPSGWYITIIDLFILQFKEPTDPLSVVNNYLVEEDDDIQIWVAASLPDFIQRVYVYENRLSPIIRSYNVYLDDKDRYFKVKVKILENRIPTLVSIHTISLDEILPYSLKDYEQPPKVLIDDFVNNYY